MNDKTKGFNMIDEFHVMYMYRKIQAEAATTDIKTLNQLLKKFRKVVAERREEYYQEIGEKKARKLKMKKILKLMEKDRISPEDLIDWQ
ncbi:DNA binding protein, nucleoid-associated [Raoultella terrigena]|uniref:DNA binding protein, nucleoid-associated n=2 Tax=Gammaproteobacteria TaxID=1236 RepID=A0A4U9D6T5_RAOTE|nr:DNA binding protein, nucleoid-associated [Raoultella terrigena]